MSEDLSVIIPSYNTGAFIGDAVASILNDVPDAEIIIVDDASTDSTMDYLQGLHVKTLEVIQLEKNSPGGAGFPSNIGIDKVKREYVAFVDSDDFFYKGYLSELLKQIKSSGTDICVGGYKLMNTVTHSEAPAFDYERWRALLKKGPGPQDKDLYFTLSPEPWRKLYRASLFKQSTVRFPVNGWFNEDYPFHWFCGLSAANGISYCDVEKYFHRIDRTGQTTSDFDDRIYFLFDHTQEIIDFIQSDRKYKKYEGDLLHWLLIGSWKLELVSIRMREYYDRYRKLLQSFDPDSVSRFKQIALPQHVDGYETILKSATLTELQDKPHWTPYDE